MGATNGNSHDHSQLARTPCITSARVPLYIDAVHIFKAEAAPTGPASSTRSIHGLGTWGQLNGAAPHT